jgi:hypothetical protein
MKVVDRVDRCLATRRLVINLVAENLVVGESEAALRDKLHAALAEQPELFDSGWYAPPPDGIGVLFGRSDDMARLDFDSLRKTENWPSEQNISDDETVGLVYASPVARSGMIGDFGLTFYHGKDSAVRQQLRLAYDITKKMCEFAQVGMKFRELFDFGQKIMAANGATSGRMALINDPSDINFGHTVPWSYKLPTPTEQEIIDRGSIDELREIISSKRIYINRTETFRIPKTCAFTVEPRVTTQDESGRVRLAYFHIIVAFRDGRKIISADFEPVFAKMGMNYIMDVKEGV